VRGLLLLWTVGNLFGYSKRSAEAEGAVQQAAAAADACVWIIGGYVIVRVIDTLTRD
jgi:hypothetical protein